ncbi:MAG TPA: hypothetical protein VF145_13660 [Chitinophagaceae bacterium]
MYQDYEVKPGLLTKSLMAALFVGIFAVLADEVYNFVYREITGFSPSQIFNVSSLIFGTLIFFMVAGLIYFFLAKFSSRADILFIVLMLLITAGGFVIGLGVQRSADAHISAVFRGLFIGVILIMGLMAAFLIPFYVKHYRKFL